MFGRQRFSVYSLIVCSGLGLSVPGMLTLTPSAHGLLEASAADRETTLNLFEQGRQAFLRRDLRRAASALKQVDAFQLPREKRIALYKMMQQIDAGTASSDIDTSVAVLPSEREAAAAPAEVEVEVATAPEPVAPVVNEDSVVIEEVEVEVEPIPEPVAEPVVAEPVIEEVPAESVVAEPVEAPVVTEPVAPAVIEEVPPAPPEPTINDIMADADDAYIGGDIDGAMSGYNAVLNSPEASDWLKTQAQARMTGVARQLNINTANARTEIEAALADLEDGEIALAEARLEAVKGSGAQLGFFDRARVDRALIQIADTKLAAAQPVTAEVAAPAVTEAPAEVEPTVIETAPETPDVAVVEEAPAEQEAPQDVLVETRKLYVQQQLAAGSQAERAGNYAVAVEAYRKALAWDPENAEIQDRLAAAEGTIASGTARERDPLDTIQQENDLLKQNTVARYNAAVEAAEKALNEQNFTVAFEQINQAKFEIQRNQRLFTPEAFRDLRDQAEALSSTIRLAEQNATETNAAQEAAQRVDDAETQRKIAMIRTQNEVDRLIIRARELQKELKYDEALQQLEQALFLDPMNVAAQLLKEIMEDNKVWVEYREVQRQKTLGYGELAIDNQRALLPFDGVIEYPADWPQITERRLNNLEASRGDSELNRRVAFELKKSIPVNFEENRLSNVIDYFRNTTNLNFDVRWPKLEEVGVDPEQEITLQLSNISAEEALERVLLQASPGEFDPIGYSIINGIVTISTIRDLSQTRELRVYDIRDLLVQIPQFADAPEFDLDASLREDDAGGGGGGDLFEEADDEDEAEEEREELEEEILLLIRDMIGDPLEWIENGGDISSVRFLNDNLIVRTSPQNHRDLNALLDQLRDTRASQINVEARFLVVDQNFLEEVNVDLDVNFNPEFNLTGPFISDLDNSTLVQGNALAATPAGFDVNGDGTVDALDVIFTSPPAAQGQGQSQVSQGSSAIGRRDATLLTPDRFRFDPSNPDAGNLDAMSFGFSYIDDIQVDLLVRATMANRRAVTVTAPRITFFNGQRAYVVVADEVSYVSDLETVPNATGFDPTVGVVRTGVILDVEGTISSDRRYVTLTLRPALATINRIRSLNQIGTSDLDTGTGGGDDGADGDIPILFNGTLELPETQITSLRSTVSIPDRGTLLMGGQRIVGETDIEAGVPVLSRIPVLNRLFTNTSTVKDERTLLVLIKPTIIILSEEEQMNFPGLSDDPSQFNTGTSLGF